MRQSSQSLHDIIFDSLCDPYSGLRVSFVRGPRSSLAGKRGGAALASLNMTSKTSGAGPGDDETLKQLLRERIEQLESREEDPPVSADEQAAEKAFQVASNAARALVAEKGIGPEEKLRVLQSMFTDCISNVRTLEYDLGLEEKRLSVAELDYSELGEDLKKIDALTDKLKTLSRELSRQNKAMMEDSEKRTAEERGKREEIVAKFDEAMKDINARLTTDDSFVDDNDDVVSKLEGDLQQLQTQYDDREKFYEKTLDEAVALERQRCGALEREEQLYRVDELALVTERRALMDFRKQSRRLTRDIELVRDKRRDLEELAISRRDALGRQAADIKRMRQSEIDLERAMNKLNRETEELRERAREAMIRVKVEEEELEFWKAKSKGELEKRETLERLCRTLTEERTIMRKEVQAMQTAWGLLEREIEHLRLEITLPERS